MAKVDILIPVYNRAEFLPDALEGLFRQTFEDFRIVIYDDGSTCTYDLPEDPRIEFFRGEENRGVAHARNELIQRIEAPLACWQDSDDVSHHQRLARLVKFMDRNGNVDMVLSWMFFFKHPSKFNQTRTVHKVDPSKFGEPKGFWNNLTFATGMFRRELQQYPFEVSFRDGAEDLHWMKGLVAEGCQFGVVPRPLYYCRRHPGRLTSLRQKRRKRAQERARKQAKMREKQREGVVVRGQELG